MNHFKEFLRIRPQVGQHQTQVQRVEGALARRGATRRRRGGRRRGGRLGLRRVRGFKERGAAQGVAPLVEVGVVGLHHEEGAPRGVADQVHAQHLETRLALAVGRVGQAELGGHLPIELGEVVDGEALVEAAERRQRVVAVETPRREEVEQHHLRLRAREGPVLLPCGVDLGAEAARAAARAGLADDERPEARDHGHLLAEGVRRRAQEARLVHRHHHRLAVLGLDAVLLELARAVGALPVLGTRHVDALQAELGLHRLLLLGRDGVAAALVAEELRPLVVGEREHVAHGVAGRAAARRLVAARPRRTRAPSWAGPTSCRCSCPSRARCCTARAPAAPPPCRGRRRTCARAASAARARHRPSMPSMRPCARSSCMRWPQGELLIGERKHMSCACRRRARRPGTRRAAARSRWAAAAGGSRTRR